MNVFLDSIGCRLNHAEVERMARSFQAAGATITRNPSTADVIVLNTCTVTAAADADSRSLIRRYHRQNPQSRIALTGCWTTLHSKRSERLPGVQYVIPNSRKDQLPELILQDRQPGRHEAWNKPPTNPDRPLRTRAFIKVQDGCAHACSFCLTTLARGASRSIDMRVILREIQAAEEAGVQEVILSGVSLNAYGQDHPAGHDLSTLLQAILRETGIPRIRLSSLEPWGLSQGLFELLQNPRICPQLHLPLQSGSASTLRRMNRPIQPSTYAEHVQRARAVRPEVAITTDLMVGFPGESEDEFRVSCEFVRDMAFANAHVFSYSPRPGTRAARISNQIPAEVKRARRKRLLEIVGDTALRYRNQFVGKCLPVLWIRAEPTSPVGWRLSGVAHNSLRVRGWSAENLWNRRSQVRIVQSADGTLEGELASDPQSPGG